MALEPSREYKQVVTNIALKDCRNLGIDMKTCWFKDYCKKYEKKVEDLKCKNKTK